MVAYVEILGPGDGEIPVIHSYRQWIALDELSHICPYNYVSGPQHLRVEATCPEASRYGAAENSIPSSNRRYAAAILTSPSLILYSSPRCCRFVTV